MKAAFFACSVAASLCFWAAAQQPKETPSWAPKYEPAKYPPGHKPHTKLADLLAKNKGKADWREMIVNDDHLQAEYIQAAPGTKVGRRFHPDTRAWWVVMDGQIRFDIEGQDSFIATKGSMVQVPAQTIYSMESIGDKPSLRFEMNIAKAKTLVSAGSEAAGVAGRVHVFPSCSNRKPFPYGYENKPHINLYELQKNPSYKGSRFVHDDRAVSNIIYGYEKNLPKLNEKDRGHYHPECAEFWLMMQGQIRYPIEKVGVMIASEGDVVYVPPFTFHAPRFYGDGPSTRLGDERLSEYRSLARCRPTNMSAAARQAGPIDVKGVRPTRVRHTVLWLTVPAYMITYMDRVVISSAMPVIQKEFGFSMVTDGLDPYVLSMGLCAVSIPAAGSAIGSDRAER